MELGADNARRLLAAWTAVNDQRDLFVRLARAAGLEKTEIHRITGIARTTVDRIVGEES